jgi:hypothetical protein
VGEIFTRLPLSPASKWAANVPKSFNKLPYISGLATWPDLRQSDPLGADSFWTLALIHSAMPYSMYF